MLRIVDLHKRFLSKPVLRGVNLEIRAGDRVLLTGPNGSGKTTLMRIACAMVRPDRGEVTWDGQNAWDDARGHRSRFGVLMDEPFLMPDATLGENLALFSRLSGAKDGAMTAWIDRFSLATLLESPVRTLSKGERQKSGLVRAFLSDPAFLLLDEPMTGLDTASRETLSRAMGEFSGTILFSSHESTQGIPWITRTLRLLAGKLEEAHAG